MTRKIPPASRQWSKDSQTLWRAIHADYQLETHHEILLRQACELLTRADSCRAEIRKTGLTTPDRFGNLKPNPLIAEERSSIGMARLTLRELGLDHGALSSPEETTRVYRPRGYA